MRCFCLSIITIVGLVCLCGYSAVAVTPGGTAGVTNVPGQSVYTLLEPFVPVQLIDGVNDLQRIPVVSREDGNTTLYTLYFPVKPAVTQVVDVAVRRMPYNGGGTSIVIESGPVSVQDGSDTLEMKPVTVSLAKDSAGIVRELDLRVPCWDFLERNAYSQVRNGTVSLKASDGSRGVLLYSVRFSLDEYNYVRNGSGNRNVFLRGVDLQFGMTEENDTIAFSVDLKTERFLVKDSGATSITARLEIARIDLRSVALLQNIAREFYRLSLVKKQVEEMEPIAAIALVQAGATVPVILRRNIEVNFQGRGVMKHEQQEGLLQVRASAGIHNGSKPVILDPMEFIRGIQASVHATIPTTILSENERPEPFVENDGMLSFDFICTNGSVRINGVELPVMTEEIMVNRLLRNVF